MGCNEWRLPNVLFNWLSTIGHPVTQKGVVSEIRGGGLEIAPQCYRNRYPSGARVNSTRPWAIEHAELLTYQHRGEWGEYRPFTVRWEGSEGSKQTKHSTRSWRLGDSRNVSFWKFTYALFWKCWFCKIRHLFRFASATGYDTKGYGQIAYETLPHILLSSASLVTKSCIARFVEGDAFNPSALSEGTARFPFPHWRTQSRPYRLPRPAPAVHGPAYLAAFAQSANKRLIAVG